MFSASVSYLMSAGSCDPAVQRLEMAALKSSGPPSTDSLFLSFFCCFVLLKTQQQYFCPRLHPITNHLCAALCSSLLSLPQLFCLCSEGRSAVTQGCHTQEKLPSNNLEGCEATVYSPPPHLMCPLPPLLFHSPPLL